MIKKMFMQGIFIFIGLVSFLLLSIASSSFAATPDNSITQSNTKTPVFYARGPYEHIYKLSYSGIKIPSWKEPEQLGLISGIVSDDSGNVYVDDPGNNCIQKFDKNGTFLSKWTIDDDTYHFAIDKSNVIYTPRTDHGKIKKYYPDGTVTSFDAPNPLIIAVNSKYEVYVSDAFTSDINKFDEKGVKKTTLVGQGKFFNISSIVTDSQNNVYVLDSGRGETYLPRIQKFDADGHFIKQWDWKVPPLKGGYAMTIDNNDIIYLTHWLNEGEMRDNTILKFKNDGSPLPSIEAKLDPEDSFADVFAFALE